MSKANSSWSSKTLPRFQLKVEEISVKEKDLVKDKSKLEAELQSFKKGNQAGFFEKSIKKIKTDIKTVQEKISSNADTISKNEIQIE